VRIIHFIVLVPFVWQERKLVGAGLANQPYDMPHIEFTVDELMREVFQQGWVARRVACAGIVERLDDAHTGKISPEAVNVARCEEAIVSAGDPGRKFVTASGRLFEFIFVRMS